MSPALLFLLCSLTIQSHLATAPLVLWAIGITILFRILRRAKNPIEAPSSQHSILCWLFGVLSWVPTILYSIKFPDGLLGSEATTSNHAPREGIVRALYFTLKVMKRFLFGEAPWTELLSPLGETSAISLLCVFALFAVSLLSQMKNSAPQTKWKGFSLLSLLLSYTLAIAVLRRPVHLHYENALVFLFPVLSGLLFHQAAMSLKSSARPHWRYLSFGFLALFLLISFRAGTSTLRVLRSKPFPSQTTVHHAKEFSEVLRELSFSADKDAMLINESEKYRESAPFVYLGRDFFPLMQYAKSFRELPEFQSSAGRSPERMLVVSCEGLPDRRVSKYLKNWKFDSEIDLHRCESCKGCTLRRWLKDSSAAVVPDRLGVEPSQRTLPEEETGQETERQLQD